MNARRTNTASSTRRIKGGIEPTQQPSSSKSSVSKRLLAELNEIMKEGSTSITAFPNEDDMFAWTAQIRAPECSVYEGLAYKLSIKFTEKYPYEPPVMKFVTSCFHPNVDEHGNICLDTLKEKWSSCNSVSAILRSLQSLLEDPNVDSPLNVQAANMWQNKAEYKEVLLSKSRDALELNVTWRK